MLTMSYDGVPQVLGELPQLFNGSVDGLPQMLNGPMPQMLSGPLPQPLGESSGSGVVVGILLSAVVLGGLAYFAFRGKNDGTIPDAEY